ncbi:multicopper oxidase domain-containing protein [Nitrosomonas sp.]|uniref:multicopper oxidase domain-containing protein n=1 Tax=Nitrosomonas sp. TaxID=42353 RepID=UPI001DDE9976|nr:multicopper oxidase domain-containing protein [Nitrosomonas sp.]MBX3615637.1 multicopper oxidase domain-containing protein [Nitrosomonas sp.]
MPFHVNPSSCDMPLSQSAIEATKIPYRLLCTQAAVGFALAMSISFIGIDKSYAAEHVINMTAEETADDGFGNKLLAYRMISHTVDGLDVTDRYSSDATIPGPIIELTEGDKVKLTLFNAIDSGYPVSGVSKQVSVHVHGVHYKILSDGTLKVINRIQDEGAGEGPENTFVSYEYEWDVAPGTAGTWAYHDHNYDNHNGSEHKGLFGAIIVNPAANPKPHNAFKYSKEYVLYLGDDAFWGVEIDSATKKQSKHGANPTLNAPKNTDVRFHLIALGTDLHQFTLNGYKWIDPGTPKLISQIAIGPLEKHVFYVRAKNSTQYVDNNFSNKLMGMKGNFIVD